MGLARAEHLDRLRTTAFDLLVVGGGITGAGIAWDAATRGLRVALIEQADFAAGTSSRSSKLIHGGLRYLAQGELKLTREAVGERGLLTRLVPHLVELFPFAFPIFHGLPERAKMTAGMWLYDGFALGSGSPRHTWLDANATAQLAPGIDHSHMSGAFVYRDARTDDARLVIEVLRAAVAAGATATNYVTMREMRRVNGRAAGVVAEEVETGQVLEIQAKMVVLATGVWLDKTLPPSRAGTPRVQPAKGVHLYVPGNRFPNHAALYLSTPRDGRLIFVVPWLDHTLIGTTDTAYQGNLRAPRATGEDVAYLLDAVNRAFPQSRLRASDVLSSQAGLRPLIAADTGGTNTASLSREDRVFETDDGSLAIAGGKLTTFRRMAIKVVDQVARHLERLGGPRGIGASRTERLPLGGFTRPLTRGEFQAWRAGALSGAPLSRARFIDRYGAHFPLLEALVAEDASLAQPVVPEHAALRAEALFAIRYEGARTLSDVLAQRLRLTLLTADQGRAAAQVVAPLLARERGWNEAQQAAALQEYAEDVAQYAVPGVGRAGD